MRRLLPLLSFLAVLAPTLGAQTLPDGLSAWWSFEPLSGRFAFERVSNSPVPVVSPLAPARFPDGPVGPSVRLDGSTAYVAYDLPAEREPSAALTVQAWVALEAYPVSNAPIANQYTFPSAGYFFGMDKVGRWYLAVSSGGQWRTVFAPDPFPKGRWAHVAGTFDSATGRMRLYLDGREVASMAVPTTPMTVETGERLTLGRDVHSPMFGPFETGLLNAALDEVQVWSVARPLAEIYGAYQEGVPVPPATPALAVPADRFTADLHRPRYHAIPPKAWTNEPHGLAYLDGAWHLFYQHNPNGTYLRQIHWGHLRSSDLVRWTDDPVALAPEAGWTNEGMWAGDAVVDDRGQLSLVFTGVDGVKAGVGVAEGDATATTFDRVAGNPVIARAPAGSMDFRDPYVWKEGDVWHLLIGSGIDGVGGTVFHYTGPDLQSWTLQGRAFTGDRATSGRFWELPVLEQLADGRWSFSVTTVEDGAPARYLYWIGTWDGSSFTPDDPTPRQLDLVNAWLSPAVETGPDGRTMAIGIVPETRTTESQMEAGWANLFSLPRVWRLCDDQTALCQAPAEEMEALRTEFAGFEAVTVGSGSGWLPGAEGRQVEVIATIDPGTATEAGVEVLRSDDGREVTRVGYDAVAGEVVLDLSRSSLLTTVFNRRRQTAAYTPPAGQPIELRVYVDGSVVEVFVDGREAFSFRAYPSQATADGVDLYAQGGTATADVQVWRLQDAGAVAAAPGPPPAAVPALDPAYPNPTTGATSLHFHLPTAGRAQIAVYDTLGRRVRTVLDEDRPAGPNAVLWDGRGAAGAPVASGVYLIRLQAGATAATRRLTVVH